MREEGLQAQDWLQTTARLRAFVGRRVSSAADAEDIVQGVLLRLQESAGGLRNQDRVEPWLFRAARNAVVDHYRAGGKLTPMPDPQPDNSSPQEADDHNSVQQAVAAYLLLLMTRLPLPYREALILTELKGLTQAEAAELIGISLSGMKSRVQRGRQRLRQMLDACCAITLDTRQRVLDCQPRSGSPCGGDCMPDA